MKYSQVNKFSIEFGRCINVLSLRSSNSNCVNDPMLSRRVDMFVRDKFNSFNIVILPIEHGRFSTSPFNKKSFLNLTSFSIELGRFFNLLSLTSSSSNCVNDPMLSRRVDMFVRDKFNSFNIESGRFSTSQFHKTSSLKLPSFPIEFGRCFNLLSLRSSSSNCVNDSMLSGRVDIFVPDTFNSLSIVRPSTESGDGI